MPLGLRVGVHTGDAVPADGDYFGTPVNAAKRLCDRASGGQILTSRLVCDLVGSGAGHRFRDLGELTLKGLLDPVASCEVVWEPVSTRPGPLPRFVTARQASPFVGRGDELTALSEEFERTRAGECRLILVEGEPGIGKTRLAAEFCADVHSRGAQILLGSCTDETLVPYQPFMEAISRYVADCRLEELRLDLGDTGGELRRLAPELAERLPDLPEPVRGDPAGERHRLYGAVARLLVNVAACAPLVLAIEDLHRADRATLALLAHVVRAVRDAPVLILGTYRGTEVDRAEALAATLADLQRDQLFERLSLAGLDEPHVADLVDVIAGIGAPPQLARDLHDRTDGNPFFIEEVLRHLQETGALRTDPGLGTTVVTLAQHTIPTGVKDVIGQRLAQLGPEAVKVLTLGSVIGREFELGLLGAVGVNAEDHVLEILEQAVRAGLIAEVPETVGRFAYAHALIRETLYDDLTENAAHPSAPRDRTRAGATVRRRSRTAPPRARLPLPPGGAGRRRGHGDGIRDERGRAGDLSGCVRGGSALLRSGCRRARRAGRGRQRTVRRAPARPGRLAAPGGRPGCGAGDVRSCRRGRAGSRMASVARGGGSWVHGVDACLRTEGATGRVRR